MNATAQSPIALPTQPARAPISQNYVTISGAYGRDYTNGQAAASDFHAGKDFIIRTYGSDDGRLCNKKDFAVGLTVNIRFKNDTGVKPVKIFQDSLR